jgi:phosphoribosylamine--glycine ligase
MLDAQLQQFFDKIDDGALRLGIVGTGGRESALHEMAKDAGLHFVFDMTANPVGFAVKQELDVILVGPEAPLVAGIVDDLETQGIVGVGPTQGASILEESKAFTVGMCKRYNIPIPESRIAQDPDVAWRLALDHNFMVVKADGLAGGKGVTVCDDFQAVKRAINEALVEKVFGTAGSTLVLQEKLVGEEVSHFWLCNGLDAKFIGSAHDYKTRYAPGHKGVNPNTGGMGAWSCEEDQYSAPEFVERVRRKIILPTLRALKELTGHEFRGVLYAGLMVVDGEPKLLEYNVRFGDPECQVLVTRYEPKSMLKNLIATAFPGGLEAAPPMSIIPGREAAVGVTLVRKEYPYPFTTTPSEIKGIAAVYAAGNNVYPAGMQNMHGRCYATGGRVGTVVAFADTVAKARHRLYTKPFPIFDDRDYRDDIAEGVA